MNKPQVGDTIHIKATVERVYSDGSGVRAQLNWGSTDHVGINAWTDDIVHVEPKPLQVGDEVTWGTRYANFKILAIADGRAWLKSVDAVSTYCTYALVTLQRVTPPRPLQVGDKVRHKMLPSIGTGEITELLDGRARVYWGDAGWYGTDPFDAFERV